MNNIDLLLKGSILVRELPDASEDTRTWIEVMVDRDDIPPYPFRTPPYAMTHLSPYLPSAESKTAKFKVRISTFNASDIENNLDPSYDQIGTYRVCETLDDLVEYLSQHMVSIDDFVCSSSTEYPL